MIGCKSKDWNPGVLSLPIRVPRGPIWGFQIGELIAFPSGLLGDFWGFIWGFLSLPRRVLSGFSGNFRGSSPLPLTLLGGDLGVGFGQKHDFVP